MKSKSSELTVSWTLLVNHFSYPLYEPYMSVLCQVTIDRFWSYTSFIVKNFEQIQVRFIIHIYFTECNISLFLVVGSFSGYCSINSHVKCSIFVFCLVTFSNALFSTSSSLLYVYCFLIRVICFFSDCYFLAK